MSNQVQHLERDLILKVVLNQVWDVADNVSHLCQLKAIYLPRSEKLYTINNDGDKIQATFRPIKFQALMNENHKTVTCLLLTRQSFTPYYHSRFEFFLFNQMVYIVKLMSLIETFLIYHEKLDYNSNEIKKKQYCYASELRNLILLSLSSRRWAPRTRLCCSGPTWQRCATSGEPSGD